MGPITNDNYKASIISEIVSNPDVILLILVNSRKHPDNPYTKVSIRPVQHEDTARFQIDSFTSKQHLTKTVASAEIVGVLEPLLNLEFDNIHFQSVPGDLHIRFSKKGKLLVKKGKPSRTDTPQQTPHNKVKSHSFPEWEPNRLLAELQIMNAEGKVFPSKYRKFRQINQFLKFILELDVTNRAMTEDEPLLLIDCGCGKAYLTFAVFHYLNVALNRSARLVGIDTNPKVIAQCEQLRTSLSYENMTFVVSAIQDYQLSAKPTVVFSLHACDTATDEAIAQAIKWDAEAVIAAPCCQHELHHQLKHPLFAPVLRHGILRERTADILTDALRALVLRIMGYKAEVIEFIAPEYTSKNLLIRAEKKGEIGVKKYLKQYHEMKEFWGITPTIEGFIGSRFTELVARYYQK